VTLISRSQISNPQIICVQSIKSKHLS